MDFGYDMSDIMKKRAMTLDAAGTRTSLNGRPPKAQKVVDLLGRAIVAGRRPAGSLLPTEEELSMRLQISRTSLREGMHALALKGLVDTRRRRGTVVNDSSRWDVLDRDVLRWIALSPDPAFYRELLEVRMIFEPAAAKIAAVRASNAQVLAIENAFHSMVAALPDDVEGCCQHDLAFHELIIASTGNPLLIRFAAAIRTALLSAFHLSSNARKSYENSLAEHGAVAVAIRSRDGDGAEEAMGTLLAGTARDLAPAYEGMRRVRARSRLRSKHERPKQ